MTNTENTFMEYLSAHGLEPADPIVADGMLHRISDSRDRPGKCDLWYILHDDGYPEGCFGHWSRMPETQWWRPINKSSLSRKELNKVKLLREERNKEQEKSLQKRHEKCRHQAAMLLNLSNEVGSDHEYLTRKNIRAHGITAMDDTLLIPLHKEGKLVGIQFITRDGKKTFLTGTEKKGACFIIPGNQSPIYIAEGYATAATIHEVTGNTVVVAFDCWNLEPAAKAVKEAYPGNEIVICADNDRFTPGNPGVTKAHAAALATGAKLVIPEFPGDEGTDFNDLVTIYGKGGETCKL